MRLVVLISLLLFPLIASANEVVQAVGYILVATGWFSWLGYILIIGSSVYGADQQRREAGARREQQRQAYNAGLRDRTITRVATDAPHRYIYGQARVGSDIVAILNYGPRDEYHYLVCIHAAHECEAIDEFYIGGMALGALDPDGNIVSGNYLHTQTVSVVSELHYGVSTFTLNHVPVPGSLRVVYWNYAPDNGSDYVAVPFSLNGTQVTTDKARDYVCHYDYIEYIPRVRVRKHLGGASDPADAELLALFPTKWEETSVLRGYCYTVVRLDLNQPEFQSGIPPMEALIRGAKLYDPRSGLTAYSANPALAIYHYLTSDMCGVDASDIPLADLIAAANVCDETITIDGASAARYTINGTVTAEQDPQKTLEQLAQCMAGGIVRTTWRMWAGKYVAPVMALEQSDIVGALSTISGTPDADLYNGVRGQYIDPANAYVVTDFKPYQNTAYVTADGREEWQNIDFPFTDHIQRVHNLCRIFCEDQRNGFTIKATFSLKAWSLKVGQRITFTSTFLGQNGKVYRVTDKRFGPTQGVELTLKEDAASIWDEADAVVVDSTPNTDLPNPFSVARPGNVRMSEEIYETTGSVGVRSRAILEWDAPADVSVIDYEVEYKPYTSGIWKELFNVRGLRYEFDDLAPGTYDFRVKARNVLGASGPYTAIKSFTVYGLLAAPATPANFSVQAIGGMALATWNRTTDLDVKLGGWAIIRFCPLIVGASWEQSIVLEQFPGDAVSGFIPLATGTYYIKFRDSTGHYSDTAASFVATEALVTGWTTVATSTQHTAFSGVKTNTAVIDGALRISASETIGQQTTPISTWRNIASLGGVRASGEYEFDARLDLGSKASRRFHASLKATSFDTGDRVSFRGNVSAWPSVSGGAINDCDVTVLASISDDDINYSAWSPFMVADFNCQYAKFKAALSSGLSTHNIRVSELSVAVKVPA